MIYGNLNISAYTRANMTIWMILAFQAGLLNIGGYMACHGFVSHVTGYATLFGYEVGRGNSWHALALLLVPLCFLTGAMIGGVLIDLRLKLAKKPKYYIVFGTLFALTLLLEIGGFNGVFGKFGEFTASPHDYLLLGLLCLICGVQNGTVTLVSRSVVRTTHLTGITTDLGIGLVRVWNARRLKGQIDEEGRANWMRVGIIVAFGAGSAAGYDVFHDWEFRGFIMPVVISGTFFFLTLYYQVIRPARRAN